jgi:hypothetical protein
MYTGFESAAEEVFLLVVVQFEFCGVIPSVAVFQAERGISRGALLLWNREMPYLCS